MIIFSTPTAIAMVVLCAFMWGSWIQTIKRLNGYPLSAYMLWVYTFSLVLVWGALLLLKNQWITSPIGQQIRQNPFKCAIAFVCGGMASMGMQNKMWVIKKIGLILASSISSTFSILLGTFYSILLGGLPEGTNLPLMIIATVILLGSAIVCQTSGTMRDRDKQPKGADDPKKAPEKGRGKVVALAIMNIMFLASAYPVGLSIVTKTVSNPNGVDSLLGIAIMCTGAFVGTLFYSGIQLIHHKQVSIFLHPPKRILGMAAISSVGHYGGNVVNAVVSPSLSVAISWPMSNSFSMWSYGWGLVYREYRGARKRTYIVLFSGILLSVIGLILFSIAIH